MCEVPHLPSRSFRIGGKQTSKSTRTAVGTMLLTDTGSSGKPETRHPELRWPYLPVCLGLLAWGKYHSTPPTLKSVPIWMISYMITLSKMDEGFWTRFVCIRNKRCFEGCVRVRQVEEQYFRHKEEPALRAHSARGDDDNMSHYWASLH